MAAFAQSRAQATDLFAGSHMIGSFFALLLYCIFLKFPMQK